MASLVHLLYEHIIISIYFSTNWYVSEKAYSDCNHPAYPTTLLNWPYIPDPDVKLFCKLSLIDFQDGH